MDINIQPVTRNHVQEELISSEHRFKRSTLETCFGPHIHRVTVRDVLLTVLENTDEQGLVGLAVPPVDRDLGMERLRDPDVQLTVEDRSQ